MLPSEELLYGAAIAALAVGAIALGIIFNETIRAAQCDQMGATILNGEVYVCLRQDRTAPIAKVLKDHGKK